MKDKNKIAVVSGGTRGIGRAIVEELAKDGFDVVFTYLKSDELAVSLIKESAKYCGKISAFKLDIRDFKAVEEFKQKILDDFGKVDLLVNNAGVLKDSALALMSRDDWLDIIDTNLNGVFNLTKAFIVTFMKQKSGNIINISSVSGVIGIARQVNYSASKGGIIAFTKALAREVAPYNIRVNAVAPGFIETDMIKDLKGRDKFIEMIPLGRFGKAQEVAKVVKFLASEESNYITGQVIKIDGGLA